MSTLMSTTLSAPSAFAVAISMRLTTRSRSTLPGIARNRTYALVTWAWITAIGRRFGATWTVSGWTRTVETDAHPAAITITAASTVRAIIWGGRYHGGAQLAARRR